MPLRPYARALAVLSLAAAAVASALPAAGATPVPARPLLATAVPSVAVPSPLPRLGTGALGADVSWPQCSPAQGGYGLPLPKLGVRFVIVGLTKGLPGTPNPCLASQVRHARSIGAQVGVYTFTAYPTKRELAAARGPYDGRTTAGRLANAGYRQGLWTVTALRSRGLTVPTVWIDVEHRKTRPWSRNAAANRAVIAGTARALRESGFGIGYYSYAAGWREITGGMRSADPVWATAGRRGRGAAAAMCATASFSGGPVLVSQWYDSVRDQNVLCAAADRPVPTVAHPLAPFRDLTLALGSSGPAVSALQRTLGVLPGGVFGPRTQEAVTAFERAHALRVDGVVTAPDWRALGAWASVPVSGSAPRPLFSR